jgi:hypothetical protein
MERLRWQVKAKAVKSSPELPATGENALKAQSLRLQ